MNVFNPSFPKLPDLPDINLPKIRIPGFGNDEPTLPPLKLPEKPGDSVQYPEEADRILRSLADKVHKAEVKEKLDYVKKMLGDFGKVQRIANSWAGNSTMNEAKLELDQAREALTTYWQGGAFDAFNTHVMNVSGVHNTNQASIVGLGTSLSQCISAIFEAYKSALTLIVGAAADAISLGLVGGLAITGIFTPNDVASKALDLLNNFIKNVGGVINGVIAAIRGLKDQAVYLSGHATQFQTVTENPQTTSVPGLWKVKPVN